MAGKRGQGEGTIVRRTDGRWCAAVSLPGGGRQWIYGKTRKEVADRMTQVLGEVQRGELVLNDNRLLGEFLEQWLAETARIKVRPSTFVSYEGIVRIHLLPTLGKVQLRKLSPAQIQRVLNRKLRGGLSPRRVQYIHAVLRHALNQAVRWQILSRNPGHSRSDQPSGHPGANRNANPCRKTCHATSWNIQLFVPARNAAAHCVVWART